MRTLFIASVLCSLSSLSYAVPHVWDVGFEKGHDVYMINDTKRNTLIISCASGTGDTGDHSVYITTSKRTDYENGFKNTVSKRPLTFLINQKIVAVPPAVTKTSNGSSEWISFRNKIAGAKQIEAYWNDQKVATFSPHNPNMTIDLKECLSKFEE